jgi:ABC-type spermidine/putrescine transport system permease subunit II
MHNPALRSPVATVLTALGVVFLVIPAVVVVLFSFHSTAGLTLPFQGFSLRWYRAVFADDIFVQAIKASLRVGATVSMICLVVGTFTAYGLSRLGARLRGSVSLLVFLPLAVPLLFVGLSLFTFLPKLGFQFSFWTVVIGHLVYVLPYYVLLVIVALDRLDPALEEVASDLGANAVLRFFRVVLPQVWPVLVAATALVFALSFDEFPITFWVVGTDQTVPLYIYALLRRSVDPTVNAISTMLIATTLVLFTFAFLLLARAERKRRLSTAGLEG